MEFELNKWLLHIFIIIIVALLLLFYMDKKRPWHLKYVHVSYYHQTQDTITII